MHGRNTLRLALLTGLAMLVAAGSAQESTGSDRLEVAQYTATGELRFPADADRWIALGSGMGGTYPEEGGNANPTQPGPLTMVQMEPSAYDYFIENGEYADGTMLLLRFFATQQAPDPELQGFVQGQLIQREIHVIDGVRFAEEGRAFFMFPPTTDTAAALPLGSECVVCHTEHGDYDGTFTQFYPIIRELVPDETTAAR